MKKQVKEILINLLQEKVDNANKMWDDKTHSAAYIVGYLEGTIKAVIAELKVR